MASSTSKAKGKAKVKAPSGEPKWLRDPNALRSEIRYAPSSNAPALLGVLTSSVGAVLAGAGFYSQVLRAQGPHAYGLTLLIGGLAAFVFGLLVSSRAAPNVRVGDAGVAVEASKGLERLGWYEIESVELSERGLRFRGRARDLEIPKGPHPAAFARAVIEVSGRLPARAPKGAADVKPPPQNAGEQRALPPPQLAGLRCRASDKLIAFEHDARLCGRCGETYHKEGVPERCLSCEARLR
ncbi:MAG: hypothetical protein IPM79_14520 [Polyangiaceae bacterium]|nr:hypothetical protein [Polyangiaceae bacterium]MBK8938800.1 hypothetical protein [Polyangiaceae bacterium]